MVFSILLALHIAAGSVALCAAMVAVLSKWANLTHAWHVRSGRTFFWGMCVVTATAIPMTFIHPNLLLLLIALFSVYMALAGWRYAKNRSGIPTRLDWGSAVGMLVVSAGMVAYAIVRYLEGGMGAGIILGVFGITGGLLSYFDLQRIRRGGVKGAQRIVMHLTMMLSATISAVTAFLVNVVTFSPGFVLWLLPTVVLTPVIILWNRRILSGKKVAGMQ